MSELMQVSLQDALAASKLQQPLMLNSVSTDTTFTLDIFVIDRLLSSVNTVTDDVKGGWHHRLERQFSKWCNV